MPRNWEDILHEYTDRIQSARAMGPEDKLDRQHAKRLRNYLIAGIGASGHDITM